MTLIITNNVPAIGVQANQASSSIELNMLPIGAILNEAKAHADTAAAWAAAAEELLEDALSDLDAAVTSNAAVVANTAKVTNATHTGDVTGATALTIATGAVTNEKLAHVATATIKGRVTAGTGDPEDLTPSQVRTLIDAPQLSVAQNFTAAQGVTPVALTDGANIATDAALGNVFTVTLGGNRTLDNPTNLVAGRTYVWVITQDGAGGRTLAYGSYFDFPGGTAPTLSTGINDVDLLTGIAVSSTRVLAVANLDFS
jgi:hypothetical protein